MQLVDVLSSRMLLAFRRINFPFRLLQCSSSSTIRRKFGGLKTARFRVAPPSGSGSGFPGSRDSSEIVKVALDVVELSEEPDEREEAKKGVTVSGDRAVDERVMTCAG